ncbi:rhomboid family intramembrane serine protease [Bizionia gelidisalsuginis]|uniref:Rhomboid family intramembrane serine protease n=2 Tax=Bizionia TaxID=283785 RepID=A0A8H2LCD2_9FLAO|nr:MULTISPECIES: rhomboid family intramembrane serine protease [Bizionia]TYB70504.1 rhomboid family intramembrane serine protease [Bizionia saleffrena]TYC10652.1 rhomboid family intramembrane serine protease [Bizionia gelidisalsuginis]
MSLNEDIKYKLARLNVLEKIIAINVIVFLLSFLLKSVSGNIILWLQLPSEINSFLVKPWTIFTYAFLHFDFFHILFNMAWLYFIGRIFLSLFSAKTALNIYFLGAIFGGLFFIVGYTVLPSYFSGTTYLVGASAAVRALFIFICAYMPDKKVSFFTFNVKLWYLGVAFVSFDVLGLFGLNSGGNLAHLGGAFLGYLYAKQLLKGNDIGRGFESVLDAISSWFKTSTKSPLKTVHKDKSKVGGFTKGEFDKFNNQKKINVILDKISKSGYDSLTAAEKEFLFRAGK